MDDAALIARARGGSTKAFESLVERHQRRVYGLALRVLRDHDQADEATQRSFVHAWEHLGAFRGESSFATWLHHIAMNECRDMLRAERRKVALDDVPEGRLASGGELPIPLGRRWARSWPSCRRASGASSRSASSASCRSPTSRGPRASARTPRR